MEVDGLIRGFMTLKEEDAVMVRESDNRLMSSSGWGGAQGGMM